MTKRKRPSRPITFRASSQDQDTIDELMHRLIEKRMSELLRLALKELLRRVKRRMA